MSLIISQNPKNLLWNIFSSDIDGFVARDLTESQAKEWMAIAAREYAADIMKTLKDGKNPYVDEFLSYEDCLAIHEEFGCEEPPVVNPNFKRTG